MKNWFKLLFVCAVSVFAFSACSKDEDEISLSKELVTGTWDVVWVEEDGETLDLPKGYIYMTLTEEGNYRTVMFGDSYSGTYRISGNTVIGTTRDPITEYYRFTSLEGNKASIDYSNSTGDKMKFRVEKR